MKKYFGVIVAMFLFSFAVAQPTNGSVSAASSTGEASNMKTGLQTFQLDPLAVYDVDGKKKLMSYSDIQGSPFLFSDWQKAIIFDNNLHKAAVVKVRYNTYSDQIHFLDAKENEMIADKEIIRRIDILKDSTGTDVQCVLERGFTGAKNSLLPDQFVEVLNNGKTQLLKKVTNDIIQKDSLMGAIKVTKFSPSIYYFLKTATNCERLRKLNQSDLFSLLPNKKIIEEYETNTKQKLRGEKELIAFLNYYNLKDH